MHALYYYIRTSLALAAAYVVICLCHSLVVVSLEFIAVAAKGFDASLGLFVVAEEINVIVI